MRFWSLGGLPSYAATRELQQRLVEKRARDEIPDTVLFLEHSPVITRGRGLQQGKSADAERGTVGVREMPFSAASLPATIEFCESERGGDLTYHGPGQLVVYPICKLDGRGFGPNHDVTGFLRRFESVLVDELNDELNGELSAAGLRADAREGAAGVWVGPAKIASIGIAVRRWVTYHGMAINFVNDLSPFRLFSPCGFSPEVMARLGDLLPGGCDPSAWRKEWEGRLARRFAAGAGGASIEVVVDCVDLGQIFADF